MLRLLDPACWSVEGTVGSDDKSFGSESGTITTMVVLQEPPVIGQKCGQFGLNAS